MGATHFFFKIHSSIRKLLKIKEMVDLEEPDKGRAWVVAFAACIINAILSGISRMIGILYVAVIDAYGVTRAEATLPFTVRNSIRALSGPLVGIIGQRFGIRAVTFGGGVVAAAGAALCCFAPNVFWLDVFWGGIHGLGFAFANTLIQVVVNQYFEKYKVTASGIALSGACVGSLGFPILVEWILDTYGLSGGFLILAGIVMNVLPPALLLSSPQWVNYPEAYARMKLKKSCNAAPVEPVDNSVVENGDCNPEQEDNIPSKDLVRSISLSDCPMENLSLCSSFKSNQLKKRKSVFAYNHWEGVVNKKTNSTDNSVTCTLYKVQESPMSEKKATFQNGHSNSTRTTNNTNNDDVYTISDKVQNKATDPSKDSPSPIKKSARNSNTQSFSQSFKSIAKLYANPVYVLLNVCMSTYVIIFIPILTVLVDYGQDKGISESDGKYLINALAIGDLFGRLGFGWVTEKNLMTIPRFMCLVLALQGVFIALFPFSSSLTTLMILLVLYGMTAGSILVLFPVLVFKYVKAKDQPVAVSCVGFLSGLVSFGIPPMIGHFRDEVGSYDGMFYLTGIVSVVSGIMWLMEPIVVKRYYDKKAAKAAQVEGNKQICFQNNCKEIANDKEKKNAS